MPVVPTASERLSRLAVVAAETLGVARTEALGALTRQVAEPQTQTAEAGTTDVLIRPLKDTAARRWKELAEGRGEKWVFTSSAGGTSVMALDEPSEAGRLRENIAAAVIYPELHMRLVSWWLVHAWRGVDLLADTLDNLWQWRITSGAVTARALVEEAASLTDEARRLADGWNAGKGALPDRLKRPETVRNALAPVLLQAAAFGSRMKGSHEKMQATNVLTLVQKLSKVTADGRFAEWYDWLSDAAHPAFGARIAFASQALMHDSGAVVVRYYARSPISMESREGSQLLEPTIAFTIADALIASGEVICRLLKQALVLVDDVGLTTAAATLTRRPYWRNLPPARGNRACPCGRGKFPECRHRWGQPAPTLNVPRTAR